MRYQCYYHKTIFIDEGQYIGQKVIVPEAVFDNEDDAERYCDNHVGWQQHGDEWIENDMRWEEIET